MASHLFHFRDLFKFQRVSFFLNQLNYLELNLTEEASRVSFYLHILKKMRGRRACMYEYYGSWLARHGKPKPRWRTAQKIRTSGFATGRIHAVGAPGHAWVGRDVRARTATSTDAPHATWPTPSSSSGARPRAAGVLPWHDERGAPRWEAGPVEQRGGSDVARCWPVAVLPVKNILNILKWSISG